MMMAVQDTSLRVRSALTLGNKEDQHARLKRAHVPKDGVSRKDHISLITTAIVMDYWILFA